MTRNRLWALGIPDLHPQAFQPRLGGGMRLFIGADAGDSQNVGESIYSGSNYESGSDPFGQSYIDYQEQVGRDLAAAQNKYAEESAQQPVAVGSLLTRAGSSIFDSVLSHTGNRDRALTALGAIDKVQNGQGEIRGGWAWLDTGHTVSLATGETRWGSHVKSIEPRIENGVLVSWAGRASKPESVPVTLDIGRNIYQQEQNRQAEVARQEQAWLPRDPSGSGPLRACMCMRA